MKKNATFVNKLIQLAEGKALPASSLKGDCWQEMQEEGVLIAITHGSRRSYRVANPSSFLIYIESKYGISELQQMRELLSANEVSRAELVTVSGDSKFITQRSFKGFLVNCYTPIPTVLLGQPTQIAPAEGSYTFIFDYEDFCIPEDVVVIGIENAENFRQIRYQSRLFDSCVKANAPILFVSRYPQNGDLVRWLRAIPNQYIHFGDLDLAGVHIYLSEFYAQLHHRASFLIPEDYESRIMKGSMERYNTQLPRYKNMVVDDERLQMLVDCIHKHHRGYDQEGYIEKDRLKYIKR